MADDYPHMVIAKILEAVDPMTRGDKYEDPLADALEAAELGDVTGGGTQLGAGGTIEYVEIEMMLANLDAALELAQSTLRELGAPAGSELQFERDGQRLTKPIGG